MEVSSCARMGSPESRRKWKHIPEILEICRGPKSASREFRRDGGLDYVISAGFIELHHYYRPPGLPGERQPWLATVWRKA